MGVHLFFNVYNYAFYYIEVNYDDDDDLKQKLLIS